MSDMRCVVCRKGPQEGVTVYRINEKGVDGLWACEQHIGQTDGHIPDDVRDITRILGGKK